MTTGSIQSFLVSKGGGLANRSFVLNCFGPNSKERQWYTAVGAPCDQTVPASHIIYYASQIYGINPQVVLATLQKEQSLVTTPNPTDTQLARAMGYASSTTDFFSQVDSGVWLLRYNYERARGNMTWWNTSSSWVCGTTKNLYNPNLYPGQNVNFVDHDGVYYRTHYLHNAATSSLYCYTPHAYNNPQGLYGLPVYGTTGRYYSGSYHFVRWFQQWFDPAAALWGLLTLQNISQPDTTPARGQTVTYTFSLTNNLASDLSLNAVGVVGRSGNMQTGGNRDFGWQGPIVFTAGETKQFTFTTLVRDTGNIYVWPAVNYQGYYLHFNNWGAGLVAHAPNISLMSPLTSSVANPVAGQTATFSATIKNNEDQPLNAEVMGIPVRFYGAYNYDTAWTSLGGTIQPGATQALSGNVLLDKPGPYTAWVSGLIANQYMTLSSNLNLNVTKPTPQFTLTYLPDLPNTAPALGEDVTVKFKLKNTLPVPMTLDAVGVVGRYGNPYSGSNHDFGWVGPATFAPGEEKTYTFTHNIKDTTNLYVWPALTHQGSYVHYNAWGFNLAPHLPNISITAPLTINSGSPAYSQTNAVSVTIKNNESHPIRYSALGVPARFYGVYSYDTAWQDAGTLAASGQTGDTVNLSGSIFFDKHGPYSVWTSILINGRYITVGSPISLNL